MALVASSLLLLNDFYSSESVVETLVTEGKVVTAIVGCTTALGLLLGLNVAPEDGNSAVVVDFERTRT